MGKFFIIQEWMVKDLQLKGLERDLYAIIYGFTQDRETKYHGSLTYLSEMTGYSKQSVISSLKKLVEKDLIVKYDTDYDGTKVYAYSINFNGVKETLTPVKETLPNNNIYNNKFLNNKLFKNNNITKTGTDLYTFCVNCIDDFCNSKNVPELRKYLIQYLNFRLEVKDKPLYKNMWKGLLNKLQTCYEQKEGNTSYIDIVCYSLEKGYTTFYPVTVEVKLKQDNIHWNNTYNLSDDNYTRREEKF